MMKNYQNMSGLFFLVILAAVLYLCYLVFLPFLGIIFVAGALSVTLYDPYKKMLKIFNGRKNFAAAFMCALVVVVIIVPIVLFLLAVSKSSFQAYSSITENFNGGSLPTTITQWTTDRLSYFNIRVENFSEQVGTFVLSFNKFIVSSIATLLRSSTELVVKLFIMLLTMFFLFRDGKEFLARIIRLTPLSDNYDRQIFQKFREVSYSAMVSTLLTGLAQGVIAGIAYLIVGVPVLLFSVATAFSSLIPFVGAALVWLPVSLYLLIIGQWWQALFMFLWGMIVISLVDNILRPLLMKGKTQVHPMILFFSIFGGIAFFGFWGIVFGPLIISIALTLLHIYEVEYCGLLDGCSTEATSDSSNLKKSIRNKKTLNT